MKTLFLLAVCGTLCSCGSTGFVKYKDSIVGGPISGLSKQKIASYSVTTPDGLAVTITGIDQDSTAPVDAWKFGKGINVLGNVVQPLSDSTGDLISTQ